MMNETKRAAYFEILKNEGLEAALDAVEQDALQALEDELEYSLELDLADAFLVDTRGYNVFCMTEIDDYLGRMYPTEWEDWKDRDFDIADDYFCTDGTSTDDLTEWVDMEALASNIRCGQYSAQLTWDIRDINETYDDMQEELKEYAEKVDRAKWIFEKLVTVENADILINAVWQAMQEG